MVRSTATIVVAVIAVTVLAAPATAQNSVFNGSFARDLRGWGPDGVYSMWSPVDAGGVATSGSVMVVNTQRQNGQGIEQCISGPAIVPGNAYQYGGKVRIPAGQSTTGFGMVGLRWYAQPACGGSVLGDQPRAGYFTVGDTFGSVGETDVVAPAGAVSAQFVAFATKHEDGGVFIAYLDDLYFGSGSVSVGPPAVYITNGAHVVGFGNVNWRTDLQIQNPTQAQVGYTIEMLKRDQANPAPAAISASLAPGASRRYGDIVQASFGFDGAAALRITPSTGALAITSRTYNQVPDGTYGQFIPGIPDWDAILYGEEVRLLQLTHDISTTTGYRSNIGFLNGVNMTITVEVKLFDASGALLATLTYDLRPYEFRQIDKIFRNVPAGVVADGYALLRSTTRGGRFFAYAAVIDNATGDPVCIQPAKY